MAVTATLLRATDYRLIYSINHDGAAGDAFTITNAALVAASANSSILQAMFNTAVANDAAAAQLLAGATPGVTRLLPNTRALWAIDIEEDGANRAQIVITGQAGTANDGVLEIQRVHSYDR